MTVVPFRPGHGLTPAELASLVVFANELDVSIETSTTDEGWGYAALDFGSRYRVAAGKVVWVVSREQGRIVAYDEEDGLLLSFKTVADALTALRRLLPANEAGVG
jgi:hypothetical protein